jgi:hypothetical protein
MPGSCQCGGIRFEVAGPFLSLAFCHCTTCKKISGGVGTANGRARTDEVTVLEGRELIETYQPQDGSAKSFCRVCGSNLFGGGWPNSEEASVRLSTIDSGVEQRPKVHNFARSVAAWETLPDDGLPRYERYAPEPWDSVRPLSDAGRYAEAADRGATSSRPAPTRRRTSTTTWRAARASRAGQLTPSSTYGRRSTNGRGAATRRRGTPTSIQSATSPRSRN